MIPCVSLDVYVWLKKRDWKIAKFQSHVIRIFNIWTILFWFDIYTRRCIWVSTLFEIIFFDQHSTCIFFSFLLLTFCWFYMWSFRMSYVNQDSAPKFMGAECSNQILGVNSSFTFHVFLVKTWQPVTIIGNLLYLDSMNISPCSFLLSKLNCCINFLLLIELFINCFEPFSKEQNTDSSNYCRLQISFSHLKCPCEMEN